MAFFKGKLSTVRIIFSAILILVIIAMIWGGIWYIRRLKEPVIPAVEALPANSAYVIEVKTAFEFWENFSRTSRIWKELAGISYFADLNNTLRSLDESIRADKTFVNIIEGRDIIIAAYPINKNELGHLFLMNLSSAHDNGRVDDFVKNTAGDDAVIALAQEGEHSIISVSKPGDTRVFYYSVSSGIFMGSYNRQLIGDALTTLDNGTSAMKTPSFIKLGNAAGKNCEATIYLNTESLPLLLAPFRADSLASLLDFTGHLGALSEFDFKTKAGEWMLNGYIETNEKKQHFLDAFSRQTPGKSTLSKNIPFNSGIVLNFHFDDFSTFYEDYCSQIGGSPSQTVVDEIEKNCNLNIHENLLDWITDEIALVITVPGGNDIGGHTFAVMHSLNPDKAMKLLSEISTNNEIQTATIQNNLYVGHIDAPGLIPQLFGRVFSNIQNGYYIRVNENIVFGNSPQELRNFSSSVQSGKTLANNENYRLFAEKLNEKSNISLYVNIRKSFNILKSFAGNALAGSMNKNVFIYRNFEGVGMQVSTEKTGMFYASVYLKYNPLYDDENPAVWETALDTTIYGRPHIIDDLSDSSKKIIAFDIFGNIYMLNSGGKILWKKPLNAKPLGDVWMMDPKKNNEYGIAFCTADRLWLLDMKGKAVDNYPVSLSAKAAGPITVLDPGNKKQYLILYPGTNKKMNCISASGSINKQWTATNLKNSISAQPVYIMTGNKDYIVFWDKSGSLYFTDKTGKANLKLKQSFKKAVNSKVYLDDATASGFITTDEKGRIASITAGGNVAFTTVGTFGSDHHFLFEDFDLDGEKDFIFFDRNTVFVYNRDEKLINQNALTGDIMPVQPRYFRFGDSYLLAAVSHENDHLILFNNTGLYDVLQKYSSTMAPVADFFYKGELPSIIAVSGKYIRYYDLDL